MVVLTNVVKCFKNVWTDETAKIVKSYRGKPILDLDNDKLTKSLKFLTGFDLNKIFEKKSNIEFEMPKYKLISIDNLNEIDEDIKMKSSRILSLKQIYTMRSPKLNYTLHKNEEINNHSQSKYVFIDTSKTIQDHNDRIIVVREPNGDLRLAGWNERRRLKFIFYGNDSEQLNKLPYFVSESGIKTMLFYNKHKYVMDYIDNHIEPDSPDFSRISSIIFNDILQNMKLDALYSTRHYVQFIYWAITNNYFDKLLSIYLKNTKYTLEEMGGLCYFYAYINNDNSLINPQNQLSVDQERINIIETCLMKFKETIDNGLIRAYLEKSKEQIKNMNEQQIKLEKLSNKVLSSNE